MALFLDMMEAFPPLPKFMLSAASRSSKSAAKTTSTRRSPNASKALSPPSSGATKKSPVKAKHSPRLPSSVASRTKATSAAKSTPSASSEGGAKVPRSRGSHVIHPSRLRNSPSSTVDAKSTSSKGGSNGKSARKRLRSTESSPARSTHVKTKKQRSFASGANRLPVAASRTSTVARPSSLASLSAQQTPAKRSSMPTAATDGGGGHLRKKRAFSRSPPRGADTRHSRGGEPPRSADARRDSLDVADVRQQPLNGKMLLLPSANAMEPVFDRILRESFESSLKHVAARSRAASQARAGSERRELFTDSNRKRPDLHEVDSRDRHNSRPRNMHNDVHSDFEKKRYPISPQRRVRDGEMRLQSSERLRLSTRPHEPRRSLSPRRSDHLMLRARSMERQPRFARDFPRESSRDERRDLRCPSEERYRQLPNEPQRRDSMERRRLPSLERHHNRSPERPPHDSRPSRELRGFSHERMHRSHERHIPRSPAQDPHRHRSLDRDRHRSLQPERRRFSPPPSFDSRRRRGPSLSDHHLYRGQRHSDTGPLPRLPHRSRSVSPRFRSGNSGPQRSRSLSPRGPLQFRGYNSGPQRSRSLSPARQWIDRSSPPLPRRSRSVSPRSTERRFSRDRRDVVDRDIARRSSREPLERERNRRESHEYDRSRARASAPRRSEERLSGKRRRPDEWFDEDEQRPRERNVDQLRRQESRMSRGHSPQVQGGGLPGGAPMPMPQVYSPRNRTTAFDPAASLWVGNLPLKLSSVELESIFQHYGEVMFARMAPPHNSAQFAAGMVQFRNAQDARSAIQGAINLHLKLAVEVITWCIPVSGH